MEQAHPAQDQTIIFVALELSKSAWLLASQSSPSGKTSSHRLEGGDIVGLLALLRRLQAREPVSARDEVQVVSKSSWATRLATMGFGCTAVSRLRG
jgi:transposase